MSKRLTNALFAVAVAAACGPESADPAQDETRLETRAERSGFLATSSYRQTMEFLAELERRAPFIRVTDFGRSAEGRTLPLVIVSSDGAFTPEQAQSSGKPIVLVQSGIHSGEIDGKDATLMLLRDLAAGRRQPLLDAGTLLFVPIYNVDGHERVSPFNRPNQDGPREGMGFRTTSSGFDLNRDHMKLDSMEARALVGLVNEWSPHLHVDNHVTDGVDHEWVLTWSHAEAPQIHQGVHDWLAGTIERVSKEIDADGVPNGPYVALVDRGDPLEGFTSWAAQPRLSTGYFALRGVPSILIEMHSYKPYETRVRGNLALLDALLAAVARDGASLVEAVENGWASTVSLGRPDAEPSRVVTSWELDPEPDSILWPAYAWEVEQSPLLGGPILRFDRNEPRPIEVPWFHRARASAELERPRGYLVMPGWPQITERLLAHGLEVSCLLEPVELSVETMRLSDPEFAERSYQGRTGVSAVVTRGVETRSVPAGALWIPADQPAFELAVQLLEPDAPDSLFAWGVLSSVVETKEYIEPSRLADFAEAELRSAETRKEWESALAADPQLAASFRARYSWWYRRTPFWDERTGLLPVYRVLHPPEFVLTDFPRGDR
jgi:murein tripeptide amidase MpaA